MTNTFTRPMLTCTMPAKASSALARLGTSRSRSISVCSITGPITCTGGKNPYANSRSGLSGATISRYTLTSRSTARNVANDRPIGRMRSRTRSTAPSHGDSRRSGRRRTG